MQVSNRLRLVFFALTFAACNSKGCSCVQPIKGGFPLSQRHDGAIQLRATSSFFTYLEDHVQELLPTLLPGASSTFNVPPSCGGSNEVCCTNPQQMCRIQINPQQLTLTPTTPNVIKLAITTQLISLDPIPIAFDTGFIGTAHCIASIDTTKGTAGHSDIELDSDIAFPVNVSTDLTQLKLNNTKVNNLDSSMVTLTPDNGDFLCSAANFGPIKSFVVSLMAGQLASQISGIADGATCMKCMDQSDCNAFATACTSGKCIGSDGKTCVQEIGIEGGISLASLLAKFSPSASGLLDVIAVAGGYAQAETGLSLGLLGGAKADPHNPCVPMLSPPAAPNQLPSTTFLSDLLPDGTTPYHLGFGVHVSELNTVAFSAWDSGALCLGIGGAPVAQLSQVAVLLRSLTKLNHDPKAPMFLVTRPQLPPTITLGQGTFVTDPTTMMKKVDDPLLHLSVPNFVVDFYTFVDDRYVRFLTLSVDLALGLSFDVDANGKLVPLLGDLTNSFSNVSVSNSELLEESPGSISDVLTPLLRVAVGAALGSLAPITLPAVMGLQLHPTLITSTDPGAGGANQFLSVFADISIATPETLAAETGAHLVGLALPTTAEFAVDGRTDKKPTVTIDLDGQSVLEKPLEWSFSVDDGGWSPFSLARRITVDDPIFWLQGRHHVDVRARAVGMPETLDPTPARVELIIDTIAPEGSFDEDPTDPERILISAEDLVSPKESLSYRVQRDGMPFSAWTTEARLTVPGLKDLRTLRVQARDEAGNVNELGFHGRTTLPPSGCGCAIGGADPLGRTPLAIALILLGSILAHRLRRRAGMILLVLVSGGGMIGCNHALGKGDYEQPLDEVGRFSDVAVRNHVFQVSAYDGDTGDLAYARIDDATMPINWQVLDGVDRTLTPDMPGDYRYGITDPGPDVGRYTSIALTSGGDPRISYYDSTNGALKFAAGPGSFQTHTVQAGSGTVKVGAYSALSLDERDVPTIAFMATGISDGHNGFKSELRLAVATSSSPASDNDWTITVVDSTTISCAGLCNASSACIETPMVSGMPNGDPSISTCTAVDSGPCSPACSSSQVCIGGTCTAFLPTVSPDLPEGIGLFAKILRVPSGLSIIYYDHSHGDLKIASQASPGAAFTVGFIDGNDPATDVGQFAAPALASDGTIHVAYVDAIHDRLLYKTISGTTPLPVAEIIDDGQRADGSHPVGAGASLILDGNNPRVVYQDQASSDLLVAARDGSWSHSDLAAGAPGYGWWPHLLGEDGKVYLSEFVYDHSHADPIGTLQITTLP